MAEVIKKEFEINVNYTESGVTSLWSSENRGINGKITCVTLDLTNHSISTYTGLMPAHSVIQLYSGSGISEQIIECGVKYVENQKIDYSTLRRIYAGSKLANNGVCELELKIASDSGLHGNISGTITVSYTEDEEEQEADTKLALDQNALSDWMKTSTVSSNKGGVSSSNQYPIDFTINQSSGNSQVNFIVWTNKGVTNDTVKKISISLNIDVTNNSSSQRTLDFIFKAAYGNDTYEDTVDAWILQPNALRNIKTAATYEADVLPNDGYCVITVNIKTAKEISGTVTGVVIFEGTSQSMATVDEEGDGSSDAVIKDIMAILDSDGFGVSGGTSGTGVEDDSFMSAYTDPGYEQDMSNLLSDTYKQSAMSDEMASRILDLEQRITALEERMNLVGVGGNEIDWYDGGSTGTDDPWGVGDWYTETDSRISQSEDNNNINAEFLTIPSTRINISQYSESGQNFFGIVGFEQTIFEFDPRIENKKFSSFNWDLLWSFNAYSEVGEKNITWVKTFASDETSETDRITIGVFFYTVVDNAEYGQKVLNYQGKSLLDLITTQNYTGSLNLSNMIGDGNCKIVGKVKLWRDCHSEEEYTKWFNEFKTFVDYLEDITSSNYNSLFAKITGTVKYQLQDIVENEEKSKDKDELEVEIDLENFTGSQTVFTYDAQSNNQILQKVEISLAFDYKYDVSQSQLCVGQLLRLDFNTVASHPGFADEVTSFSIGQESISNSEKSSKQRVYKATYSTKSFANNGNCAFKVDFSTPEITTDKLADFKQYFTGKVTGTVKYTTVPK